MAIPPARPLVPHGVHSMKPTLRARLGVVAAALWIGLGAIFFGVGGDDPSRVLLSGSVKIDGQPLDHGTIYFLPVSSATEPTSGSALVDHGEFAVSDDASMTPGTYTVKISGLGLEGLTARAGEEGNAALVEPLPRRYNEESELEVVIPHCGTRHLEFNLNR